MADHPTDAQLRLIVESDAPAVEWVAHLDACAECRARMDRLVGAESWAGRAAAPAGHDETALFDAMCQLKGQSASGPLPQRVGPYLVRELIGRGGMGIVYKAFDPNLHRVIAVKVMAAALAGDAVARQRFLREARAAAAVCHEHVVTIHAVEEGEAGPYLVMQYVAGQSLQAKLERMGPLGIEQVLRIGMQTAQGLAAAHAQGVVHRDIKPANILLENGIERVKITDFGLARAADDAALSQSGVLIGTPQYMAPEQAEGRTVDHRADLFGLGCVLYAACSGRPPFRGPTPLAVLKRVCDTEPPSVRHLNPDVPPALAGIIEKLLAKDPADRYQSATAVAADLETLLAGRQLPAPPRFRRATPAKPKPRAAVALIMLGLIAACVLGFCLLSAGLVSYLWSEAEVTPAQVRVATPMIETRRAGPPFEVHVPTGAWGGAFDDLADAVNAAGNGDIIEIHGDGPFEVPPVTIQRPLIIRPALGCRPVLTSSRPGSLLQTDQSLALEGLTFRWDAEQAGTAVVATSGSRLAVTNCRFEVNFHSPISAPAIAAEQATTDIEVRNCLFLAGGGGHLSWTCPVAGRCTIDNNVFAGGGSAFTLIHDLPSAAGVRIALRHNTMLTTAFTQSLRRAMAPARMDSANPPVTVEASYNLFDPREQLGRMVFILKQFKGPGGALPAAAASQLGRRLLAWKDRTNLYGDNLCFLRSYLDLVPLEGPGATVINALPDWFAYWNAPDPNTKQDTIRYGPPDPREWPGSVLVEREPYQFRLTADSPGRAAGPGGRDLGADVYKLVGPGTVYDTWRQSADYRDWQRRADPTSESRW